MSEIAELKKQIARLEHRLQLLELYVDSEKREREGWTLDRVRDAWRGTKPPPPYGAL
jgi:hypothetical protein